MFGLLKKKKKYVPDPKRYPLDTCLNFVKYVKLAPNVSDDDLVFDIMQRSGHNHRAEVLDLVRTTRDALPK